MVIKIMKNLRDFLRESKEKGVTFTFGRFNPPTVGHAKLVDKLKKASGGNFTPMIFTSHSQDAKKNPLDYKQKITYLRKFFKGVGIVDTPARQVFEILTMLQNQNFTAIRMVVGSDRVKEFEKLSGDYNGKLYAFDNVEVRSAGDRDPDSDDVSGMSASKQRLAAAEGDFKTFRKGVPASMNDKQAREIYNTLRAAMQIKEGWSLWEIAPKFDWLNLRENYVQERIYKVGQMVENLNTGLVGKIIRRGKIGRAHV